MEQLHLSKDLLRGAVGGYRPFVQHHHPLGFRRLIHVVGNEHHGNALLPVQPSDGVYDLPAASGIQHGGGLVQNDTLRLHGNNARDGDALLLPAGQKMGGVLPVLVHVHLLQGAVHSAADFRAGNAQILRAEGHILFHHVGNDLVVRILENHAHVPADGENPILVGGVDAADVDLAAGGKQYGIEMLGQGGFPAAVGSEDRHKASLLNGQIQILKNRDAGGALHAGIGVGQVFNRNDVAQIASSLRASSVRWHRKAAPVRRHLPADPAHRPGFFRRKGC